MTLLRSPAALLCTFLFTFTLYRVSTAVAQEIFRVSYGGYNETATPMWLGADKGFFKKYRIDASRIQVRSGALASLRSWRGKLKRCGRRNRRF
jgi:ABC-type nitrate/sulfonate/bicarbonate transport system substrate-binding protein